MIEFPEGFLWGAATSAYQVEGNNINSDWWKWEIDSGLKEVSGQACRHYEYYREDFNLASSLHHNCHRLSIEWSRIEPEENKFSDSQIQHYVDVISSLKELGLEPIVTLQHFTIPQWFSDSGGWRNKKAAFYFKRYVEKIVEALCDKVQYWVTINEPLVYVYHSYVIGAWPPQERSLSLAGKIARELQLCHIEAYKLIHSIYKKRNLPSPKVSIAKNVRYFTACKPGARNKLAVYLRNKLFNISFLDNLKRAGSLDFIGINYYTRELVDAKGLGLKNLLLDVCNDDHGLPKNSLGWEIYPEGLYNMLLALKKYGLPVFILENGICTQDDSLRWKFIREHLACAHRAIKQGVRLLGYIYWSLIDNYEWDKGFGPRFGLIGVDYNTFSRSVRESAKKFSLVCKANQLGDAGDK